jgi:hypothetical protein
MAPRHFRFALLVLLAAPLYADNTPALISDVTARDNDSRLVRAAKNAVASRQLMAAHSSVVIDNLYLRRSRATLTTTSHSAALPTGGVTYVQPQPVTNAPPTLSPSDRAALQQKVQQLNMERARMAEQADQPYAGDISEDRVDQRLSQIPNEINQAQRQLATPPAPPTPRPPQE